MIQQNTGGSVVSEALVATTAKLYEIRRTVRSFLGDKYQERMRVHTQAIREIASEHCLGELEAATKIAQGADNPYATLIVLAAYVEMTEEVAS